MLNMIIIITESVRETECLVLQNTDALKEGNGMANSVDPDQIAPLGAI